MEGTNRKVGVSLTNQLGQTPFVERLDMADSVRLDCPQKSGNGRLVAGGLLLSCSSMLCSEDFQYAQKFVVICFALERLNL